MNQITLLQLYNNHIEFPLYYIESDGLDHLVLFVDVTVTDLDLVRVTVGLELTVIDTLLR